MPLLRIPIREIEEVNLLVKRLTDGWHNRCRHLGFCQSTLMLETKSGEANESARSRLGMAKEVLS